MPRPTTLTEILLSPVAVRVDGAAGGVGRKPLVALSPDPTRGDDGQAVGGWPGCSTRV